jgi:ubiquinone/menaquinone biosynthesis C-methylase UbiE
MTQPAGYILGQSERAARRLEVQDAHVAEQSERLLDDLALRPTDRVVELGCGPGGLSRRIMRRLGAGGVLVGVDSSEGLLEQAGKTLNGVGPARFEAVRADVAELGPWLAGADVVVGRAVLHHVPMAELVLGRLRTVVRPGTRVGFIEPDFRSRLGRMSYLEATGHAEVAPLRIWATAINALYLARRISPDVGATLAATLDAAGYRHVRAHWAECPSDELVIENMVMFYDEVRDALESLGIATAAQIDEQMRALQALAGKSLPAVWGVFRVTADA